MNPSANRLGILLTLILSGCGSAPSAVGVAALTITPNLQNYGPVAVDGMSAPVTFTVANGGSVPSGPINTRISGPDAASFRLLTNGCAATLEPSATCTMTLQFNPTSPSAKAATLEVLGSQGVAGTATLNGSGQSSEPADAQLVIAPLSQDFGQVVLGSRSAVTSFTVTNTGNAKTTALSTAFSGPNASQFIIVAGGCTGAPLAPHASCSLSIAFKPTAAVAATASLDVTSTVASVHASAGLTGEGITPPTLTISPLLPAFPDTAVGTMSESRSFTVTNTGTAPTGSLTAVLGGTHPADFLIVADTNGCRGVTLSAGATCTVAVRFAPGSSGTRSASLTVTGNPGGSTPNAALSGIGLNPAFLTLSPSGQEFGSIGVGDASSSVAFTVTNLGQAASGPVKVVITGLGVTQFALAPASPCGAALATGVSCSFNVVSRPTSVGAKNASLDVSATPGGMRSSPLQGTGIGAAAGAITTPANFGDVTVGQASTVTLTVTNNGAAPSRTLLAPVLSGTNLTDFTILPPAALDCVPNTTVLASSGSCTIRVRFAPTSAMGLLNPKVATLTVPFENGIGGMPAAALTGNARALLTISSSNVFPALPGAFNTVPAGVNPATAQIITFTLNNNATNGGQSTGVITIDPLAAPSSNQFDVCNGSNCGGAAPGTCATGTTNLTPGNGCTIRVQFLPNGAGTATSALSAFGTAPSTNASVALSGTST